MSHLITLIACLLIVHGTIGMGIRRGWSRKTILLIILLLCAPAIIAREFYGWNGFKIGQ